jgi:hypothetical protein
VSRRRLVRGAFRRPPFLALVVAAAAALTAADAHPHGRSVSTSTWEVRRESPAGARISVRVPWADLQRVLVPAGAAAGAESLESFADLFLTRHFTLRAGDEPCSVAGPVVVVPTVDPTHLGRSWSVVCSHAGPLRVRVDAFFDAIPAHLHLARLRIGDSPPREQIFVLAKRETALEPDVAADGAAESTLLDFVRLGIEHIATGYDHVAFLLALLLAGRRFRELVGVVTGFTAAHSVTLALGVLGLVRPASGAIEALIGLSIVVVAAENFAETVGAGTRRVLVLGLALLFAVAAVGVSLQVVAVPVAALAGLGLFSLCHLELGRRLERPARLRWLIAFVFGLVHGFGFAGVLAEAGLPAARVGPALLGFNVGVELGQVAIVALAWPLLQRIHAKCVGSRTWVIQLGSTPVLAAGLYWFISRAFGS